MQKVWHRAQTGWWYASIKESGIYRQIKLVKAPNDKPGKSIAEAQLIQELALKHHVEATAADGNTGWVTVIHVVNAFLKHSQAEHELPTARWYRDMLIPFREKWGKLRIALLRKKHIREWLAEKGYNPTTANKALGAVKRAFNWAVEEEYIPKNPIAHVKKEKALVRDRTLTPEERTLILSSIKDAAFLHFVKAMTLTGCRPGEVARVTAADVDLAAETWVLRKHKTAKMTGKPRIVYLCPEALELTRELIAKRPEGTLFLNSRSAAWTRNAVRTRFRRLREKFPQLKGVIAYTFRSSFATDALAAGVADSTVATLLGHTGTATLHKFYARLSHKTEHLKEAAARATQKPRAAGGAPPSTL